MYCWGDGSAGQLGLGTLVKVVAVPRLVTVPEGRRIAVVACGATHTVALSESSHMFAWGAHDNGRLGLDSTREKARAVEHGHTHPPTHTDPPTPSIGLSGAR